MKEMNRRDFLRLAGLTAAVAALSGCKPTATSAPMTPPTAAPEVTQPTAAPAGTGLMSKKAAGQTISAWGWDKPEFNKVLSLIHI